MVKEIDKEEELSTCDDGAWTNTSCSTFSLTKAGNMTGR
jgi:hypothetical protein